MGRQKRGALLARGALVHPCLGDLRNPDGLQTRPTGDLDCGNDPARHRPHLQERHY